MSVSERTAVGKRRASTVLDPHGLAAGALNHRRYALVVLDLEGDAREPALPDSAEPKREDGWPLGQQARRAAVRRALEQDHRLRGFRSDDPLLDEADTAGSEGATDIRARVRVFGTQAELRAATDTLARPRVGEDPSRVDRPRRDWRGFVFLKPIGQRKKRRRSNA
jgi:hypothetical protein